MVRTLHIQHTRKPVTYPIYLESDCITQPSVLSQHLQTLCGPSMHRILIVTDSNVGPLYGDAVAKACQNLGYQVQTLILDAGERTKCWASAEQIFQTAMEFGLTRQDRFMALGGGVIGDLVGYCAATYHRGTGYLQLPTTLVAQVDSSVGGKVAIHVGGVKNSIGAFYHPQAVLMDPATLATLPVREWQAGMAEVVKYALLEQSTGIDVQASPSFLEWLEQGVLPQSSGESLVHALLSEAKTSPLVEWIAYSCQLKQAVVQVDETEQSGHRMILNLGHTFAHILESATQYTRFLHGEAVALGLVAACRESAYRGHLPADDVGRVVKMLDQIGLPTVLPADLRLSVDGALNWLQKDKKNRSVYPHLILPVHPLGTVQSVPVLNEADARHVLTRWLEK